MAGEWIAILAVFSFVISNVIFRRTEKEASPIFINFIRTAIGTITFLILSLIYQSLFAIFLLPIELWIILCLSFLFGQVIGDTSYFQAQKRLGTTLTLAISMTFPFFTLIFSLIFLNHPLKVNLVLSLIFISVGIIIISKTKISSERSESYNSRKEIKNLLSTTSFRAIMFALIAAVTWAIGLVMIDFATNEIDKSLNIGGLSSIIGNVIRFPFALLILFSMVLTERVYYIKGKIIPLQKKTPKIWAFLIIASIIGTSLGAYLYTEAARTAGAAVMSLIASASPLFSLPLTYWVNKEKITKIGFLGVLLTIIGVILAIV
ncbi:MAG: DMT family transporter [Promethearchaeota archaeon]